MNKVICDVCGTAYPETSAHCPICGCAKKSVDATAAGEEDTGYAYVKGGRFSKQNVRKRSSGIAPERVSQSPRKTQERPERVEREPVARTAERSNAPVRREPERPNTPSRREPERPNSSNRREPEPEEQSNTGLILVVIFLLIAIIAVVIYIGMRVFGPNESGVSKNPTQSQITLPTGGVGDPTQGVQIPCQSIQLSSETVELSNTISSWTLLVNCYPEGTTDVLTFESSAPSVVIVDENGELTAVSSGTATIIVTCGNVTETCQVICTLESAQQPTDPPTPEFTFEFNTKYKEGSKWDITLKYGNVWTCYKTSLSVDPSVITWTSDNPAVCTIQNGIVTIVGPGTTEIHAQYAGKTYTCIVRTDKKSFPSNEEPTEPDDGGDETPDAPIYTINKTDVTIAIGESFTLKLLDANNNAVEVVWTADNATLVTIDGNKITGAASGTAKVSTTYEGVTYTCIVRVK